MTDESLVHKAAKFVASADALIIGAGAGMGVDSGLPDFRGNQRFWHALLIRINPREPDVPQGHIGLAMGALEGLRAIQDRLETWRV